MREPDSGAPAPNRPGLIRRPLRPDASMDLLTQIIAHPVDPDYAVVAARGRRRAPWRWDIAVTGIVVGILFTVAALGTTRAAPALATERQELIDRIQSAEQVQDARRRQITDLTAEIARLRSDALGGDETARETEREIAGLEPLVGAAAVRGPGVLVVVDDAPGDSADSRDRVLDIDLQILANGLWQAGAEAIAINGHRLSSLTAIRGAGDAVTVDYRSLTRPYRVEAIGDPKTLPARWVESAGGAWWNELAQNRKMTYEVSTVTEMTLDADPGLVLRVAKRASA